MPKVHNIGKKHFFQFTKFPYEWGGKFVAKGWTQEIEEPFRTSEPTIVRLPKYKAFVFGTWTGQKETEQEAFDTAFEARWDLDYDDFTEEAGWTPAPEQNREESISNSDSRLSSVDGAFDVHDWKTHYFLAEGIE